jgi:hypothetical protein
MKQGAPYWSALVNVSPEEEEKRQSTHLRASQHSYSLASHVQDRDMPNFGIPHRASGNEGRERGALNWRRGLFRVWLLLSAGWIMGWTIYLVMDGIQGGLSTPGDWTTVPIVLFAPPVALGIFGAATIWALRGFTE